MGIYSTLPHAASAKHHCSVFWDHCGKSVEMVGLLPMELGLPNSNGVVFGVLFLASHGEWHYRSFGVDVSLSLISAISTVELADLYKNQPTTGFVGRRHQSW